MITVDLFEVLQAAWQALCADYDVTTELPDFGAILDGADPENPPAAARVMLVNMLCEMMECVSRFSPWYKRPARAFGIELRRDPVSQASQWTLSTDALQGYASVLAMVEQAVEQNRSVILATRFLDDLEVREQRDDPCLMATCRCDPPRVILIHRSVAGRVQIICDACKQPFE